MANPGQHGSVPRIYTITFLILLLLSVFLLSVMPYHQALARCPNGTRKSPSGDCEAVVPQTGLPRCPNGFHRSPSGNCEEVSSSSSPSPSSEVNDGSSSTEDDDSVHSTTPSSSSPIISSTVSTSSTECDQTLWNHVYNPTIVIRFRE